LEEIRVPDLGSTLMNSSYTDKSMVNNGRKNKPTSFEFSNVPVNAPPKPKQLNKNLFLQK